VADGQRVPVPKVAIAPWNGAPALLRGGRSEFPMWFWQREVSPEDGRAFLEAGVDTFSFCCPEYYLYPGWVGEGRYDDAEWEAIMARFLDACPGAYCFPRLFVDAPPWWLEQHPEECCQYATRPGSTGAEEFGSVWGGTRHASFASERWRRESGEAVRRFIEHLDRSPYRDRVLGIHVANGIYGEWHAWSATDVPDSSEPMRQALIRYLRETYGDEAPRLQAAWGQPELEFDMVSLPSLEERRHADRGPFRDPAKSGKVIDYYRCLHAVTASAIDHFCRIVKEASQGRLLTVIFYSYTPDLDWPQEGDHRAAAQVHRLESVDIFSSPHSYARRKLGQDGLFRNYPASLKLHGKLFLDEADDRTHLARDPVFTHVTTVEESLSVLRREFANAVTQGVGLWYMDQQGDWFHDPQVMAEIKRLKAWGDRSLSMSRESVAEIAVISCLDSQFYLGGTSHATCALYRDQIGRLCEAGAPFDWYLIEDLEEGRLPSHKLTIFLDAFYLTARQRAAVEGLKAEGRTLLWFYAPGYITDEGLSVEAMSQLVGMPIAPLPVAAATAPPLAGASDGIAPLIGPAAPLPPLFAPTESALDAWGTAVRDFGTWRSVYCAASGVPAPELRRIAREAGVHVYSESDDPLMANASWVSLHAASDGVKTLRLPRARRVWDVVREAEVGASVSTWSFPLRRGETALFALDPPPDHAR
jgi:hypothetical protein